MQNQDIDKFYSSFKMYFFIQLYGGKMKSILLMFFLMFARAVYSGCDQYEQESSERIYLQVDQMSFYDSKIFVRIDDEVFLVPAIFCDQKGYYVLAGKGKCQSWKWKCKKCGECIDYEHYTCPACGRGTQDDAVPRSIRGVD